MFELPFPLIADIAEGRCIPFVGAGFSRNAVVGDGEMPDWAGLASVLVSEGNLDSALSPPQIAQEYERRFGRVQLIEAVRRALHIDDARPGKSQLAFAQLPFDTVYTTNFDLLLESSYAAVGRPFRSLVGEKQLPFHAGQTATSIIKMHGDLRHEEHIVLTQHDYDDFLIRYPVVATHLSAMLITRTPLFIGYSLTDPDFNSIRAVVRSRLGQFERMSYVIQFGASNSTIDAALEDRIHIINIPADGRVKDLQLEGLFQAAQQKLDARAGARLRRSRPDIFEEVPSQVEKESDVATSALLESTSRLCFVMMPFSEMFDRTYRELIVPAVEDAGLLPVRADEISGAGFVMEQIRAAIQQSRLCIADITDRNPNVLYEVGFAQAMRKPVIIIANDVVQLPFDVAAERVIWYSADFHYGKDHLRQAIASALTADRFDEAQKLLASGSPRAAIAVTAVILEHLLRELANRHDVGLKPRTSPTQIAVALQRAGVIDVNFRVAVEEAVALRNQAVHAIDKEPTTEDAQKVLKVARAVEQLASRTAG